MARKSTGIRATRPGAGRPRTATRISLAGDARLPATLAPRKRPGQRRSEVTVDAVLQAASELFARQGYARTNTNAIAARAGISVGSLYQYFPNKDAILTALLERHLREVDAVVRESMALLADVRVPLRTGVRQMLERLVGIHDGDPALARAVEAQVGQMPRIPTAFRDRERAYVASLEEVLRRRPDVRRGDAEMMASLLFEIAETTTAWLAHGSGAARNRDAALAEATHAVCRYLEE